MVSAVSLKAGRIAETSKAADTIVPGQSPAVSNLLIYNAKKAAEFYRRQW